MLIDQIDATPCGDRGSGLESPRRGRRLPPSGWSCRPTTRPTTSSGSTAAVLDAAPEVGGILIVDDDSPDGTGRIADRLAAADSRIEVLHRDGEGGTRSGLRRRLPARARRGRRPDRADGRGLLPRPRRRPAAARGDPSEADLALGSRYVAGGGVGEWGRAAAAISRWGSVYARLWLGIPIRDLTGGFKCYPARGPRGDPARERRGARLRLSGRNDLSGAARRLSGRRGPDRLQRPPGRRVEDEPVDRRRGGRSGCR